MNQETMNEFQIKKNQILCWWKLVEGRQWAGKPCSGGSVFGPELWAGARRLHPGCFFVCVNEFYILYM